MDAPNVNDHTETLIKQHETVIQVNFKRSTKGLIVTAKAHPAIEELVQSWGDGSVLPVLSFGRHWTQLGENPLNVYALSKNGGTLPFDGGFYRLDRAGHPIIETGLESVPGGVATNLSFLRLQGVSEGTGVSFLIKGVHTMDAIKRMGEQVKMASRSFYINFMRPIDITVRVSTEGVIS